MVARREAAAGIHEDRLVFPRGKSDRRHRLPLAARVLNLEGGERYLQVVPLRYGDVDAGVGGIDPAAEIQSRTCKACLRSEIENQLVWLDDALVLRGHQLRDVSVVLVAHDGQQVPPLPVDGGDWSAALDRLEHPQRDRPGRNESLVDEHLYRVRMVDGDQADFVHVRGLPELFGELHDVAAI